MSNTYRITEEYLEPVKFVLERDEIPYEITKEKEEYIISTDLNEEEFGIILEDAECEIERIQLTTTIPIYSLRTYENKRKLKRLMKLNGRRDFHIMKKDEEAFARYYN